jgi:hypothetical protein
MKTRAIKFFLFCWPVAVFFFVHINNVEGADVQKTAQQFILDFQRGARFSSSEPLDGLAPNKRVVPATLFLLSRELASGTSQVREEIVRLLEKLGLYLDSPEADKIAIIRDRSIIRMLLVQGFAKDDPASNIAAGIVRDQCKPADLAFFNELYLKSLRQSNGDYLYLVAKAKTQQALPLVENLTKLPVWQAHENDFVIVKIAQAALGNTKIEDEFIDALNAEEAALPPAPPNRFYDVGDAKDGRKLAEKFGPLGFIGTNRSLAVLCSYLRSPLKTYVPNIKERSIRYYALDAIRYNFPDERVLLRPTSVSEWAAAEQFCTRNIGFVFEGPTPDLPLDRVYPTRILSPSR